MSDEKLNLYAKLLKITEEIGKIEKTGRNSMQNYSFIEQAQVVAELRPQLAKYGVFIIPETIDRTVERFDVTRSNGKQGVDIHVNVKSRYTVVNADNPDERFVCEWDGGEAIDSSDKATNKATTASHKYFLMKLFNISDKEDGDNDSPEPPPAAPARKTAYATPKQIDWMRGEARKVSGLEHNEDIDKWIEQTVGAAPQKLGIGSVMKAIDRIKAKADAVLPDVTLDDVADVTDEDIEALKRGELPG